MDKLTAQFFTQDSYWKTDLSLPTRGLMRLYWLASKHIEPLDLVVHHAAVGHIGLLSSQLAQNILDIAAVNFAARVDLRHKLFPLIERGSGRFVFVSSLIAAIPAPDNAFYAAIKAALEAVVRSLRIDLAARGSRIAVQVILLLRAVQRNQRLLVPRFSN